MEQHTLWVEPRQQTGKGVNRKIRKSGKVPAVLYGMGKSQAVVVDPVTVTRNLLNKEARNWVYSIEDGALKGKNILIKDWQVDPLSRRLVHVDLLEIDVTKKIKVTVALSFVGKSAGVAEGGVLNIIERTIEVMAVPNKIPKNIEVDVTSLAIGRSIHLSEITLPEGVEKATQIDPTLVACVPPAKDEDATPSLTAAAEPEVITAKKVEGEEGAKADDKAKK
jgi:large subunit ribosomal protein L25